MSRTSTVSEISKGHLGRAGQAGQQEARVHFGGPDRAPGLLRDLLAARIDAVPQGGSIHWVAYYLRDRRLAERLIEAHRRGVAVRVTLERRPRIAGANDRVIALLAGEGGLGAGFRAVNHRAVYIGSGRVRKPNLHTKLYCFSHPIPTAFVGSYNPTCDEPERQPEVRRAVGDHDRGHNVLVELEDEIVVNGLTAHARYMHDQNHGWSDRFKLPYNRRIEGANIQIHFWPRVAANPIHRLLSKLGSGDQVRLVASHLKGPGTLRPLAALARRGVSVQVLGSASRRRVSTSAEEQMAGAGVPFHRVPEPGGLPMHLKFLLIERRQLRTVVFGSYNWTFRGRWLNHELAAISKDPVHFEAFAARFVELWRSRDSQTQAPPCAER